MYLWKIKGLKVKWVFKYTTHSFIFYSLIHLKLSYLLHFIETQIDTTLRMICCAVLSAMLTVILCYAMICCAVLSSMLTVMLCYAMIWYAVLSAMLTVLLCYDMICCDLCSAMIWYAVLSAMLTALLCYAAPYRSVI